ncbi:MAG: DUF4232 domain-containing protein [Burkholderiaceae bacterium]
MNTYPPLWALGLLSLCVSGCAGHAVTETAPTPATATAPAPAPAMSPTPAPAPASATAPAPAPAACNAAQLVLSLDSRNGWFDGMSHSGTLLVLRNTGNAICKLPARPEPILLDAAHRSLPIVAQAPAGMHPGPVLPPLDLTPGARAESEMRWVSGNVYDDGRCLSPAFIVLPLGTGAEDMPSAAFTGRLCGPGNEPLTYTVTLFKPIPSRQP